MRQRLRGGDQYKRHGREKQEIETSILVIGGEDALQAQEAREQRPDPQHRGADALEKRKIGPDRERHDNYDREEENHADAGAAAGAERKLEIAFQNRGKNGAQATPASEISRVPGRSRRTWVAAMTMPPRPRCSCINRATSICPSASSALAGSSRSQIGRCETRSRASAARRRSPAESTSAGSIARVPIPIRPSAASTVSPPPPNRLL